MSRACGEGCGGGWVAVAGERWGATMRVIAECDAGCGAATREVTGCGDPGCGARSRPIGQGLISQGGPCPREPRGGPKCGQGPRRKIRPCPLELRRGKDEDLSVADFSECLPHPAHYPAHHPSRTKPFALPFRTTLSHCPQRTYLTRPTLPHPYEISTLRPLEKERTVSTVEA